MATRRSPYSSTRLWLKVALTVAGVLAGIVSPLVSWWALRRAPLWRTVVEPLGHAVAGGGMAVLIGVPALILVLPPVGLALGFARLRQRYPEPRPLFSIRPAPMTEAGRPPAIHADGFASHA